MDKKKKYILFQVEREDKDGTYYNLEFGGGEQDGLKTYEFVELIANGIIALSENVIGTNSTNLLNAISELIIERENKKKE